MAIQVENVIRLHIGALSDSTLEINGRPVLCATLIAHGCNVEDGEYVDLSLVKGGEAGAEITTTFWDGIVPSTAGVLRADMRTLRIGDQHVPVLAKHLRERYDQTWVTIDCRILISSSFRLELV